jgi:hypothetical protein
MIRNFVATTFLTIAIAAPVLAEPIPLLEMKWQIRAPEFLPVPGTVEFSFFGTRPFGDSYFGWIAELGSSDAGKSFWAPPAVVDGANAALRDPTVLYGLINGPANFANINLGQNPPSEPPCPGRSNRCIGYAVYVEDIDSYRVTAVERFIDYLSLTPQPQFENWIIDASQSIRYWGTPIPEPGSAMLLLMGVAHFCLNSRPRRRS